MVTTNNLLLVGSTIIILLASKTMSQQINHSLQNVTNVNNAPTLEIFY